MALAYLMIFSIFLVILALGLQVFLYSRGNGWAYGLNAGLGLLLSYLNYSALPTNYRGARLLALAWGVLGLLGLGLARTRASSLTRALMTLAVLGGILQLLVV